MYICDNVLSHGSKLNDTWLNLRDRRVCRTGKSNNSSLKLITIFGVLLKQKRNAAIYRWIYFNVEGYSS